MRVYSICFKSFPIMHTFSKNMGAHCTYGEILFKILACKYPAVTLLCARWARTKFTAGSFTNCFILFLRQESFRLYGIRRFVTMYSKYCDWILYRTSLILPNFQNPLLHEPSKQHFSIYALISCQYFERQSLCTYHPKMHTLWEKKTYTCLPNNPNILKRLSN